MCDLFELDFSLFRNKLALDIDVDLDVDAEAQLLHESRVYHPQRRPNELSSCVAMFLRRHLLVWVIWKALFSWHLDKYLMILLMCRFAIQMMITKTS